MTLHSKSFLTLLLCLFLCAQSSFAAVSLPSIFSDNMVLQQNTNVAIWGKADPGETIQIKTSWLTKTLKTKADPNGKWAVQLPTYGASKNHSIQFKGKKSKIIISNVLIGEVWLCTGQSNMEFPIAKSSGWKTGMLDEDVVLKDADYPEIRLFQVEHKLSPDAEQDDCVGKWVISNAENIREFSAVGYVFGRKLHKELKVPVGLIQSTWGGTHAESWTKMDVMKLDPLYKNILVDFDKKTVSERNTNKVPATLWNGMIAPIRPFTIKGNIWYQGESNSIRFNDYQQVFTNLIQSWRKEFENANMPFYFVQIAPHYRQPAGIREAQLKTWMAVENTGMVVTTDVGDSTDIHPRNKTVVGERLAAWALAKTYERNIQYSGPRFKSMEITGNVAKIQFDFAESGLEIKDPAKSGLMIAGADGMFYPAKVTILNREIYLSSDFVPNPTSVRYGWGKYFHANLYNKDGYPASPFRTDNINTINYAKWFADSEMRRFPEAWQLDHGKRLYFGYSQGLGCLAMLRMWKATGDQKYFDYVKQWADTIINEKGEIHEYKPLTYNIDYINPGKVLFDVYRITGDKKYKLAMDRLIAQLKKHPRTSEGGFWHKLIYPHQIWLDGIYMGSPFMAQYGLEFNQPEWIDEAIHQVTLCFRKTYDPKSGLLYHAWDESKSQRWANPETGLSPHFWGRSIGWYFMATVDVLDYIPENHPRRHEIIDIINKIAVALPNYVGRNGLLYQIVDQSTREGNYAEASVNTQCMYAIAKAVNKGYLTENHRDFAEKLLKGLQDNLLVENPDGTITLVKCCAVAGLGGNPYRDGSYEYYINERIRENDAKATGPFIMACIELGK